MKRGPASHRLLLVSAALGLCVFGCADSFGPMTVDGSGRDFSATPSDLMESGDLAVADLLLPPDLGVVVDLAKPPDLLPLMCDLRPPDDGGAAMARLYLAGIGPTQVLGTARFSPAGGWSSYATVAGTTLSSAALSLAGAPDVPVLVARYADDTLASARFEPCLDSFGPLLQIHSGASTARPVAVTGGLTIDLLFRGSVSNDQRLYHSRYDGSAWSLSVGQNTFLSDLPPSVVRYNGTVHALFTGTNTKIYDGVVSDAAGGGTASEIAGCTSDRAASSVLASDGTIHVVFKGIDTNLYWTNLPPAGAWSAAVKVCPTGTCLADTNDAPVLALESGGTPIVAFVGKDKHVYTSSLSATWSSPIAASSGSEATDHLPALVGGIGGKRAELVYVRNSDGLARHARLGASVWADHLALAGAMLAAPPALVSLP